MSAKFPKNPRFYNAINVPHSTFGTNPNDVHKHKRGLLNPFFSRKTVLELEDVVQDKAKKLVRMMENGIKENKPVDLHHGFRCVSIDVITVTGARSSIEVVALTFEQEYSFGESYDLLDAQDLGSYLFRMIRGIGPAMWIFQQFPAFQALALMIPPKIAMKMNEPLGQVIALQTKCSEQIEEVKDRMKDGKLSQSDLEGRPTIFTELLNPEKQDGHPVPTTWQLKDEAFSVVAAAADTTGNAMTIAAYHVMKNPDIYKKLREELIEAFPNPDQELKFVDLEKLPYLTGVVKEGLRLSFGVPGRLSRVVPAGGATFNGYYIAEGCCVGMSSWIMHQNADIFPNPSNFDPERWTDIARFRAADRGMVPFGRGTRQCVGMPLAYAEQYVSIGSLFRKFDGLQVYKTTMYDLEFDDFFSSYHVAGRNWFKAVGPDYDLSSA